MKSPSNLIWPNRYCHFDHAEMATCMSYWNVQDSGNLPPAPKTSCCQESTQISPSPCPSACTALSDFMHDSSGIPFSFCLQSFPALVSFPSESTILIRWPKYWSFIFSISPSNQYSGLISFRMDWFGLLTVQGTLESLLQHHNLKASVLQCSTLFMVQLSTGCINT